MQRSCYIYNSCYCHYMFWSYPTIIRRHAVIYTVCLTCKQRLCPASSSVRNLLLQWLLYPASWSLGFVILSRFINSSFPMLLWPIGGNKIYEFEWPPVVNRWYHISPKFLQFLLNWSTRRDVISSLFVVFCVGTCYCDSEHLKRKALSPGPVVLPWMQLQDFRRITDCECILCCPHQLDRLCLSPVHIFLLLVCFRDFSLVI
jgi:hypothetical protein